MLTFAGRTKSTVFGSHSTDTGNSSPVMGQGGGGTSRLKRLSWMLHPSRSGQTPASSGSPQSFLPSTKASVKEPPTKEPTNKAPKDAKLASTLIPQQDAVNVRPIATPNATTDGARSLAIPNSSDSADADADADTSRAVEVIPEGGDGLLYAKPQLTTATPIPTATSVATSASTSNQSSNASEEVSTTDARVSSISFPMDLPKPDHSPANAAPIDAVSESSFGRKPSVSSVSFGRSRNLSVAASLHKQAPNGSRTRNASPPPQRYD